MTEFSVHTGSLKERAADPLAGRLRPSALVIGGVLAAALTGAAFATSRSALFGETVAPEPPFMTTIISTSVPQSVPVAAATPGAPTRPSFAFGFLEFDWDPDAPGGVPGFDFWPKHDLSAAQRNPRN